MSKEEFLNRWSKRKLAGEQEDAARKEAGAAVGPESALSDEEHEVLLEDGGADLINAENSDEQLEPHPAEGIDIDELEYESDFTVFMQDKVPDTLRRMALRKLWKSSPILANVDGLNDYDEDFSDATAVFINSTGGVISGARDQFTDDKPFPDGKAETNQDDRIAAEQETAATDAEVSDAEDTDNGKDEREPDTGEAASEEDLLTEAADQKEINTVDAGDAAEDSNEKTKT